MPSRCVKCKDMEYSLEICITKISVVEGTYKVQILISTKKIYSLVRRRTSIFAKHVGNVGAVRTGFLMKLFPILRTPWTTERLGRKIEINNLAKQKKKTCQGTILKGIIIHRRHEYNAEAQILPHACTCTLSTNAEVYCNGCKIFSSRISLHTSEWRFSAPPCM